MPGLRAAPAFFCGRRCVSYGSLLGGGGGVGLFLFRRFSGPNPLPRRRGGVLFGFGSAASGAVAWVGWWWLGSGSGVVSGAGQAGLVLEMSTKERTAIRSSRHFIAPSCPRREGGQHQDPNVRDVLCTRKEVYMLPVGSHTAFPELLS